MTYKITEHCVMCGGCSLECPTGAITEGEKTYVIDPDKCTDCGACIENNYCPAWAIVQE